MLSVLPFSGDSLIPNNDIIDLALSGDILAVNIGKYNICVPVV
jgi:hypothetical protein